MDIRVYSAITAYGGCGVHMSIENFIVILLDNAGLMIASA